MAISKVVYKSSPSATPVTWMDTTQKTVTSGSMLSGTTALKNDGTDITGSIATKTSSDLTASGDTVTAPAGYYASSASKSVASGSEGTPTATKGTVSSNSISVTPSVTNTAGYISGGTKTGTAVTVSASELVSGTKSITSSGDTDVTNYATASVAAGSATAPASISGTSATVSTGTNTLTLSKTVSVTPTVSAGYVSSGTTGNSSVSLTASVNTRSSSDLTASTLTVTAPSGYYANNATKTLSDQNLVAENIKKDVEIFGVTGSYEGGGGTSWETLYYDTISIQDWGEDINYAIVNDYFVSNPSFALGDVYRITWGSDEYTCSPDGLSPSTGDGYLLGNGTLFGGSSGNNEPFVMQQAYQSDNMIIGTTDSAGYKILKIEKQVSGGITWETVYNDSVAVTIPEDDYYLQTITFGHSIDQNSVWKITWNGTPYECTATSVGDPVFPPYALGNDTIIHLQGGNNEPFYLQKIDASTLVVISATSQTVSLKIEKQVSSGAVLVPKTITQNGTYDPADDNADGYSEVTVNVSSVQTTLVVPEQTVTASDAITYITSLDGFVEGDTYIVTVNGNSETTQCILDGNSYVVYYTSTISVIWIYGSMVFYVEDSSEYGTYTVKVEKVTGGGGSTLITKTITANGTYDAEDDDADGYSEVTVAIPNGTAGTPTATKGTVSNHSISVIPSVTNTAGVISGGTINGTAVTVSASELVSGSETKTSNGTYDVTNLAQLVVNVSGGSGLEYETGTYTPSSNTAQPTISFANSHSRPPVFVCISDTSSTSGITSSSNTSWSIIDYYRINGAGFPYSTSATRYGLVTYSYRSSNNTTVSSVQIQHTSDETGTSDNSYYRYWATASAFKPSSTSTSRYWRSGRTYKWIAVWK